MNYRDKVCLITGAEGFIGSELALQLQASKAKVIFYDKRLGRSLDSLVKEPLDYVFHFGSPSSQVLFKKNMGYCVRETISGFNEMAALAIKHNARLIYPSTGLVSTGELNEYAQTKSLLESIHLSHNLNALGLRIFATYGPGEQHKGYYQSVISLFITDVLEGRRPQIYGSGDQSRDFIYIDDVVEAIMVLAEHATEPIIEVGSGESVTFNQVIGTIEMVTDKEVVPLMIDKPEKYIEKTVADTNILRRYYKPETSLAGGIIKTINYLNNS